MRKTFIALGLALLLAAAAAPAAQARQDTCTIIGYHTVRSGETVYCIARAYGVSPWAIASCNGLVSPSHIRPGQVLAIPATYAWLPAGPTCTPQFGDGGDTCSAHHTVASGQNLYRISLQYSVDMWQIAECNNIYNLNYIRAGDVLCIP